MTAMTRRQFMLFALHLAIYAQVAGCRSRSSVPVLGRNPLAKPLLVEDHSQALAHWAEQGVRDATLLHIDTHDDFRWIPDDKIAALQELYQRKDWQRFRVADSLGDQSLYTIGNWIYAGARLGIFTEVNWVIPFNYLASPQPDMALRQLLSVFRFTPEDIATFTFRDNRFSGSFRGIPVTICGRESLPDISDPVLLSFDVDFFPTYSEQHREPYLSALQIVFAALREKNYRVVDAVVSSSVNGDFYLPPHLRWLVDEVVAILERPMVLQEDPPERLTLLQQLDNDYRTNDGRAILSLSTRYMQRNRVPSVLLYRAYAHLQQGNTPAALASALECCRIDRLYCTALPFMGIRCFRQGKYAAAEKFFRAGVALDPAMRTGLYQFGHTLRKLGRFQEALAVYEQDARLNGSFPTRFLIAETYMMIGDRGAAVAALRGAMAGLASDPYPDIVSPTGARAMYAVIDFCDKNGMGDMAEILRSNPAVVAMYRTFPRAQVMKDLSGDCCRGKDIREKH